jgi:non-specific serine/threonine protein kinase
VLDNAEHLLDACVQLIDRILRCSSSVVMLVTSRQRLGLAGERTFRVPSLTVPGTNETLTPETVLPYEGVRLFIDRAKLVRPGFDVTAENASALASICARLDGMPLAIELAAPRLRSMSVDELSQRLDQRFALLTDGSRTALPRHRTLRSTIDWSYDLLTEREQAMLRRVTVFAGGWTLASAEQVCAGDGIDASDVCEQLTSLVDKSLAVTDEKAGATRYRMLETVRQYALDRLRDSGEEARWRGGHLAYFAALAEEFFAAILGPKQQSWLGRIAPEHDNLRAALAWSVESSPVEGLRLVRALTALWRIRGQLSEGREWLARLLDAVPIDSRTPERAHGLYAAAMLAILQADYAAGERLLQESLAIFREIDDPIAISRVLGGMAYLSIEQGHYREAEALSRESADGARATGNRRGLYSSLGYLAIALHRQGQWPAARELYEEALQVARELGTPWEIGAALRKIGLAESEEGRHDLALKHLAEGMTILHGLSDRLGVIESLEGLAGLAAATAAPRRAARLWGAAHALRQETGYARSVRESIAYDEQVKADRERLTAAAFDQAWDAGRAMTLDDAVRCALDEQAGRDT